MSRSRYDNQRVTDLGSRFSRAGHESECSPFFIGLRAAYFRGAPDHACWVSCVLEFEHGVDDDGPWFDEQFHLDCTDPHPAHWLADEIDGVGLGYILHDPDSEKPIDFLLQNGVAPGQRFDVHIEYHVSRCWHTGETDAETSVSMRSIEKWGAERVQSAWEEYLEAYGLTVDLK